MFTRGYPRAHRRLGRTPRTCPTSNPSVVIPQVRPVSSLRKLHQVSLKLGWAYEGASFHPGKWDQESWSISVHGQCLLRRGLSKTLVLSEESSLGLHEIRPFDLHPNRWTSSDNSTQALSPRKPLIFPTWIVGPWMGRLFPSGKLI